MKVRCHGLGDCRGRATLSVQVRRPGKRPARRVLGAVRFNVAAGKSATVQVRLGRAGRSRLARSRNGRLTVRLGGTGLQPRKLVLEASPPKKRR